MAYSFIYSGEVQNFSLEMGEKKEIKGKIDDRKMLGNEELGRKKTDVGIASIH